MSSLVFYNQRTNMNYYPILLCFYILFTSFSCGVQNVPEQEGLKKDLQGLSVMYVASGCFWCVEAVYESVKGVAEAESGYSGGKTTDPTYQSIGTGKTGHAEAVKVYYNSEFVSFETLIKVFYNSGDPTTLNKQGPDRGSQYRSILFYQNEEEKEAIKRLTKKFQSEFEDPIITEVLPFEKFYIAEEYHQNFEKRNPSNSYVRAVSIPRLLRFQAKMPEILK